MSPWTGTVTLYVGVAFGLLGLHQRLEQFLWLRIPSRRASS